jgi:hypothetical protein
MSERRKPEIDLKPLSDLTKLIEKSFSENIKPPPAPEINKPQPKSTR